MMAEVARRKTDNQHLDVDVGMKLKKMIMKKALIYLWLGFSVTTAWGKVNVGPTFESMRCRAAPEMWLDGKLSCPEKK